MGPIDVSTTTDAAGGRAQISARTLRTDRWWLPPLLNFAGITAWVAYATVRAFQQDNYYVAEYGYLTPFYSPCVSVGCIPEASHFGQILPDVWWLPYAALSLPFLLLFRLTCYYYRKTYYRAFWLSPPACAVAEPHKRYTGETRFPLIAQNLHRYFFYGAVIISVINTYDMILAFTNGVGVGSIILLLNVIALWAFTISCHSCRSIVGGRINNFSKHPSRYRAWMYVSRLNAKHMQLAWLTLGTLAFTDFYVMSVAAGWITDLRIVG